MMRKMCNFGLVICMILTSSILVNAQVVYDELPEDDTTTFTFTAGESRTWYFDANRYDYLMVDVTFSGDWSMDVADETGEIISGEVLFGQTGFYAEYAGRYLLTLTNDNNTTAQITVTFSFERYIYIYVPPVNVADEILTQTTPIGDTSILLRTPPNWDVIESDILPNAWDILDEFQIVGMLSLYPQTSLASALQEYPAFSSVVIAEIIAHVGGRPALAFIYDGFENWHWSTGEAIAFEIDGQIAIVDIPHNQTDVYANRLIYMVINNMTGADGIITDVIHAPAYDGNLCDFIYGISDQAILTTGEHAPLVYEIVNSLYPSMNATATFSTVNGDENELWLSAWASSFGYAYFEDIIQGAPFTHIFENPIELGYAVWVANNNANSDYIGALICGDTSATHPRGYRNDGGNTNPTSTSVTCAGVLLTSQLAINSTGYVVPPDENVINSLPRRLANDPNSQRVGTIPAGRGFFILDGPVCNDEILWWQVDYRGTVGWTGETGQYDEAYWIIPYPSTEACSLQPIGSSSVNLRSGPGTNYDRLGTLAVGQTNQILGYGWSSDGFRWWQTDLGWARTDLVDIVGYCVNIQETTP